MQAAVIVETAININGRDVCVGDRKDRSLPSNRCEREATCIRLFSLSMLCAYWSETMIGRENRHFSSLSFSLPLARLVVLSRCVTASCQLLLT